MCEDGATHDRKVCIGPDEIVRELSDEIKQLQKRRLINLHRRVRRVQHDAVLVVVHVWRILAPLRALNLDRDDTMILTRRIVHTTTVALALMTELALRITRLLRLARRRDGLRILLRLRQIDRDIEITVLRMRLPLHILLHTVTTDVVRIPREGVVPFGRLLRALLIETRKSRLHLRRTRGQRTHQTRIEKITINHRITAREAVLHRIIIQRCQYILQVRTIGHHPQRIHLLILARLRFIEGNAVGLRDHILPGRRHLRDAQLQRHRIQRPDDIRLLNQPRLQRIRHQILYSHLNVHSSISLHKSFHNVNRLLPKAGIGQSCAFKEQVRSSPDLWSELDPFGIPIEDRYMYVPAFA